MYLRHQQYSEDTVTSFVFIIMRDAHYLQALQHIFPILALSCMSPTPILLSPHSIST